MENKQSDCEYWSFKASSPKEYAEVYSPVDSRGEGLEVQLLSELPQDLSSVSAECVDKRTVLPDFINCVSWTLILSSRAADVFRRFRLGDARFIPVTIVGPKKREPIGTAEVVAASVVDFVDMQRSSFVPISKGSLIPWYFTAPPVVLREKLSGLDFAYGLKLAHACSNDLRRAILQEKLTNFLFEPLDVR
jgi:hypothetical protein